MNPLHYDPPPASALFADRRPGLRAASLEELDKIVENSSEKNRNFFIATLGLLVYVQAIVFATTDLQLLTGTALKLPIVDLDVPLVGFYVVVPIFVIALHFNFLQNLESHHYKLMRWKDAHPGGLVPRSRIQPFLFDYAMLETGSQMERWVRWANSLLVLNLAPITLGLLLWRYTDRQEAWVTVWHYLAFGFDSYLVWKLRVALRRNREAAAVEAPVRGWRRWLSPVSTFVRFLGNSRRHGLRGVFGLFLLVETVFTVLVSALPSEAFVIHVLPLARDVEAIQEKRPLLPGIASLLLPRIAIDPTDTVWKPDQTALETEARMAGTTDWVKHFNEYGTGFRPSTSRLRMADLRWQKMPRADFSAAKLDGGNLESVNLQGAILIGAQLNAAKLFGVQLQGAYMMDAQLQGSDLGAARLQGADLMNAEMQGAYLMVAQMQGANLMSAQLQGAYLGGFDLPDFPMLRHYLGDHDIRITDLRGANLVKSKFQAADLRLAALDGVIIFRTALNATAVPTSALVWAMAPPFESTSVDWSGLAGFAPRIPTEQRKKYLDRVEQAKARQGWNAAVTWKHDSGVVYREVLPALCGQKETKETRLAAISQVRENYRGLVFLRVDNSELLSTLTEIDRTLCTLSACADLKDHIEGLDCGPFTEAKPSPRPKR